MSHLWAPITQQSIGIIETAQCRCDILCINLCRFLCIKSVDDKRFVGESLLESLMKLPVLVESGSVFFFSTSYKFMTFDHDKL